MLRYGALGRLPDALRVLAMDKTAAKEEYAISRVETKLLSLQVRDRTGLLCSHRFVRRVRRRALRRPRGVALRRMLGCCRCCRRCCYLHPH